jgi:hypothetical protein
MYIYKYERAKEKDLIVCRLYVYTFPYQEWNEYQRPNTLPFSQRIWRVWIHKKETPNQPSSGTRITHFAIICKLISISII